MAPRPQKRPDFGQKMSKITKTPMFCSCRGSDSCYISTQPLYLYLFILSEVFRSQEGISRSQNGSPSIKASWIARKKSAKNSLKITFCSDRASDSCRQSTTFLIKLIISKTFRAQEGISRSQNSSPTTKQHNLAINRRKWHPKIFSCYDRGLDNCYIDKQSLYFYWTSIQSS